METTLVLLVDGHTLDSYLVACALDPQQTFLLYDRQMLGPAQELAEHLGARLGVDVRLQVVADDSKYQAAAEALASVPPDAHLHFTGGTGQMAPHAVQWFRLHRPGARRSHMDEERRRMYFEDDSVLLLRDLVANHEVTLDDIACVQGYETVNRRRLPDEAQVRDALLLGRIATERPISSSDAERALSIEREAQSDTALRRFVQGGWLEILTAATIRLLQPSYELSVNVRLRRNEPTFELDVVAVGRFHPYVVSCTTSRSGTDAKRKLFEVKDRTQRLAGAVGRPALVTLADTDARPSPERLRQDMNDLVDTPTTPVVFDRKDVEAWTRLFDDETAVHGDRLGEWLRS